MGQALSDGRIKDRDDIALPSSSGSAVPAETAAWFVEVLHSMSLPVSDCRVSYLMPSPVFKFKRCRRTTIVSDLSS